MTKRNQTAVLCAGIALASIAGCAVRPPAGTTPGGELKYLNWWNFYQRGVERLEAGDDEGALADFERSLGLRPGANFGMPKDTWRIRTYGMHFVESYFPQRELGIAHYRLGRPDRAIRLLETSLAQTPSGRAKRYLNRARRASLQGTTVTPPEVSIGSPGRERWTRQRTRVLEGTTTAEGFVDGLAINGHPLFVELAEQAFPFRESLALARGRNIITVKARDLLGQETVTNLVWIADWSPPHLELHRITRQRDQWILEGTCRDDFAVSAMTIDGSPFPAQGGGTPTNAVPVRWTLPTSRGVPFTATDAAGNELTCELTYAPPPGTAALARYPAYAQAGTAPLADVPPPASGPDRLIPRLRIASPPQSAVFDTEFYLDGEAEDRSGLASIRVNGEELLADTGTRPVVRKYFAQRLSLLPGTNHFSIVVTDLAGNVNEDMIRVVRKTPEHIQDEYRLTVGLPPFRSAGQAHPTDFIRFRVEQELLRDPARFTMVERDEGWDYILRELRLSLSQLTHSGAALRVREMLGADLLFLGTILGEDTGITLRVKVIDCEQGRLLWSGDVYAEEIEEEIEYQAEGLVMKIEQRFPLLEGRVTHCGGKTATIDLGADHGVWPGARFLVLEPGPDGRPGSYQGLRKIGNDPVQLQLSRATRDSGVTRVLPTAAADMIQEGDYVYSR